MPSKTGTTTFELDLYIEIEMDWHVSQGSHGSWSYPPEDPSLEISGMRIKDASGKLQDVPDWLFDYINREYEAVIRHEIASEMER